jgi:ArsR family transcriptional regulator
MLTLVETHGLHGEEAWYLTGVRRFDNYRTVSAQSSTPIQLLPGQFERIAKALSDPRRFAMLEAIGTNCGCPNQALCQDFPVSKATISHHLKELVQAGLVETDREGQYMNLRARPDVLKAYADELVRRVSGSTDT